MSNVVDKFLRYVAVDTQSAEGAETVPSTEKQFALAKLLVEELKNIGAKDVSMSDHGYVYATIPATVETDGPVVGFLAHMDTSPDCSGENVHPQLIKNYDGKDIILNKNLGIHMCTADFPYLKNYVGMDLITTDGTTLLGGDDKAGVAEIITALEYMAEHQDFKHGKIAFSFTPDEEIGTSQDNFDVPAFGADFAYTVDGADFGDIEYENFYGASLTVDIKGVSTHPGEAKDKMKNASLIAMEFDALLPPWERPEHTQDYEGFYHLMHISGDCGHCQMNYIIREHDYEKYQQRKTMALQGAEILNQRYGEGTVSAEVKDGYRNMAEMVRPHMHLIDFAKEAIAQCGVTPRVPAIRGGTDGSELSYKGVPCPNLGTGSFNHHSLTEVANIDHMDQCTEVILKIISRYAEFEA